MLKTQDFDYNLPPNLIAQEPAKPRDHSRLLLLGKKTGKIEHKHFYDIVGYFQPGDVLVMNNSRVFPARLHGKRKESGGRVEIFLLRDISRNQDSCTWQCLLGGKRMKVGLQVEFEQGLVGELKKDNQDSTWQVEFNLPYEKMMETVEDVGEVPLPPYIRRRQESPGLEALGASWFDDKKTYQTVYADETKVGSVAAPTAGLHFTEEILQKLKNKGVQIEYVTLHVGLGTFAPVKVDDVTKHKMHAEFVEIEKSTIEKIKTAKQKGQRVVAVGTTSVRSLESFFSNPSRYELIKDTHSCWVDIFIYPGYEFRVVDMIITNFHLPKSTLMMLVSAFSSQEIIMKAYETAVQEKYRFFSYGDAMLIC